jgi:hypothetical protein
MLASVALRTRLAPAEADSLIVSSQRLRAVIFLLLVSTPGDDL